MRVLLVKPPTPTLREGKIAKPPLELLAIASAARSKRHNQAVARAYGTSAIDPSRIEFELADWSCMEYLASLEMHIWKRGQFDVVGVTAMTPQIDYAHLVSDIVKRLYPSTVTVLGGPHVTLTSDYSSRVSTFDVINKGEGVESFPLILNWILNGTKLVAPDVLTRVEGCVFTTTQSQLPKLPLDEYPLPSESLDLICADQYDSSGFAAHNGQIHSPVALIQTNVGCGLPCSFCAVNTLNRYRAGTDLARVVREMEAYLKRGFRLFHLIDDIFAYPVERPVVLAELLHKRFPPGELEWVFNVRADKRFMSFFEPPQELERRLVSYFTTIAQGHCRGISIGVESGDERVLQTIDKSTQLSHVRTITKSAQVAGLGVKWYLMVGLPGQDWSSIEKTTQLIREARPTGLAVSILVPHMGTKLFLDPRIRFVKEKYAERIACPEPKNRYTDLIESPIETDTMSAGEITAARQYIIQTFLELPK